MLLHFSYYTNSTTLLLDCAVLHMYQHGIVLLLFMAYYIETCVPQRVFLILSPMGQIEQSKTSDLAIITSLNPIVLHRI